MGNSTKVQKDLSGVPQGCGCFVLLQQCPDLIEEANKCNNSNKDNHSRFPPPDGGPLELPEHRESPCTDAARSPPHLKPRFPKTEPCCSLCRSESGRDEQKAAPQHLCARGCSPRHIPWPRPFPHTAARYRASCDALVAARKARAALSARRCCRARGNAGLGGFGAAVGDGMAPRGGTVGTPSPSFPGSPAQGVRQQIRAEAAPRRHPRHSRAARSGTPAAPAQS